MTSSQQRTLYKASLPDNRRAGFSLMELVIVILITGIVAATAVPTIRTSMVNRAIDRATGELARHLTYASTYARANREPTVVRFSTSTTVSGGRYWFPLIECPGQPGQIWQFEFEANNQTPSLDQAPDEITFDRFGYPTADSQITFNQAFNPRTVFISQATGRIEVQ